MLQACLIVQRYKRDDSGASGTSDHRANAPLQPGRRLRGTAMASGGPAGGPARPPRGSRKKRGARRAPDSVRLRAGPLQRTRDGGHDGGFQRIGMRVCGGPQRLVGSGKGGGRVGLQAALLGESRVPRKATPDTISGIALSYPIVSCRILSYRIHIINTHHIHHMTCAI